MVRLPLPDVTTALRWPLSARLSQHPPEPPSQRPPQRPWRGTSRVLLCAPAFCLVVTAALPPLLTLRPRDGVLGHLALRAGCEPLGLQPAITLSERVLGIHGPGSGMVGGCPFTRRAYPASLKWLGQRGDLVFQVYTLGAWGVQKNT